jgi:hypothetical protein
MENQEWESFKEDDEEEKTNLLMCLVDEVIEEITKPIKNKKKTMYYALEIRVLADKTDVDYDVDDDEIVVDEWDFITEVITKNVNGEDVEYLLKNKLNDDFPNNYVQVATMEATDDPEELEEYLWK